MKQEALMGIEKMLRMHPLRIWFHLSDPGTEEAIYGSYAIRKFTGVNIKTERVPDDSSLYNYRESLRLETCKRKSDVVK